MKLEDLKPRPSKIYLSKMEKEYTLRPWTLQDQIWMNQEYGDKVQEIFSQDNIDIVAICRMAYRLMVDKSDFRAMEVVEIDEDGIEEKFNLGGYKLLVAKVADLKEQMQILASVVECIGLSMPEVDEIRSFGQEKKKVTKQTGAKS